MLKSFISTESSKLIVNSSTPLKKDETVIESPHIHFNEEDSLIKTSETNSYRSTIGPRSVIIQRGNYKNIFNSNNRGFSMQREMSGCKLHSPSVFTSSTNSSLISSNRMNVVKQSSDKGKKDMQDVNERLASYIEKVRFLEAQNNKLMEELKRLKTKWGKETSQVKAIYHAELDEARKLLDEVVKEKSRFAIKVASLEDYNEETFQKLDEVNRQFGCLKSYVEKQNHQMIEYESELSTLRKRIDTLEGDRENDKKAVISLNTNLNKARNDLDNELLLRIDAENRKQTLEEDIAFLKIIHEQEMKELAALAYRDSTVENREYWMNEMGQAVRDIQKMYDDKLTFMKEETDIFYNRKCQDFKTGASRQSLEAGHLKEESKRLRLQIIELKDHFNEYEAKNIQLTRNVEVVKRESENREKDWFRENEDLKIESAKMKAEIESMFFELQSIVDAKLGFELEIAAYRKLLEIEEGRPVGVLKNIVDTLDESMEGLTELESGSRFGPFFSINSSSAYSMNGGSGGLLNSTATDYASDSTEKTNQLVKGKMQATTNYKKSAKGPLSVSECSSDGKYIVVDNTSLKVENLTGWKVVRTVDKTKNVEFQFKEGFSLDPNSKIKVWAKGFMAEADAENDLVCSEDSWGVGAHISTKLYNPNEEEKASHIQKTSYV